MDSGGGCSVTQGTLVTLASVRCAGRSDRLWARRAISLDLARPRPQRRAVHAPRRQFHVPRPHARHRALLPLRPRGRRLCPRHRRRHLRLPRRMCLAAAHGARRHPPRPLSQRSAVLRFRNVHVLRPCPALTPLGATLDGGLEVALVGTGLGGGLGHRTCHFGAAVVPATYDASVPGGEVLRCRVPSADATGFRTSLTLRCDDPPRLNELVLRCTGSRRCAAMRYASSRAPCRAAHPTRTRARCCCACSRALRRSRFGACDSI